MAADEQYRLNGERWREQLERAYDAAPGPAGAAVIVVLMQVLYTSMMDLYDQYIHIPALAGHPWVGRSRFKRRRLIREFRKWNKDALAFGERLDGYWSDSCTPGDPCPDELQPQYTNTWVAAPVLEGDFPDEYYLGLAIPGRPDAVELAALWNQVVAVKEVLDNIGDTPDQLLIEWLESAGVQLRKSLPGEPETWRDQIDEALDAVGDGLKDIWEGFGDVLWYVGAGLGAWLIYAVATRGK